MVVKPVLQQAALGLVLPLCGFGIGDWKAGALSPLPCAVVVPFACHGPH